MTIAELRDGIGIAVASASLAAGGLWLAIRSKVDDRIEKAVEKHQTACLGHAAEKLESIEGWCRGIDTRQEQFRKEVGRRFDLMTLRIDNLANGRHVRLDLTEERDD